MSKLSYDEKIQLYQDGRNGMSKLSLSKKYNICIHGVQYLCCLIDIHGYDILRTSSNKCYSKFIKQDAIDRVLNNNESIWSVSLDIGLPRDGMLHNWIKKYKENGSNIVERKRGRPTMNKVTKKKENETDKEKIKKLEEENEYLKAELEYLKKLKAVVQARKNQQRLKNNGIKQSMSRKENSMDNGMMENFFGLLKTEMFYDQEDKYKNIDELILAIDDYINYYNYDRIKVKLKGLYPVNYRLQSSN